MNKVRDEINKSDDPLAQLGPGICSYHHLLTSLIKLFLILFVINIPMLYYYNTSSYYNDTPGVGFMIRNSLGNMGYSKTECVFTNFINGMEQDMSCKTG